MAKVTGLVGWVGQNKFGKFSLKLEDNDTWFGSKFEIPCAKGDTVEFDSGSTGKYCDKLAVVSGGTTAAVASTSGSPTTASTHDQRQQSIVYQSSRKDAINFLDLAIKTDALKLPKAKGYETLLSLVDETTLDFARKAISPDLSEDAEPVIEVVEDE